MKQIRCIVFVCLGLLAALPAAAYDFSAMAPTGQTLYYNIEGGGAVVTYPATTVQPTLGWLSHTRPVGTLTIPATVTDSAGTTYNVVAVGSHALYGCTGLTSVTLASGVAAVRGNAFNGCTALTSVVLPASVDTLGSSSFKACTALQQFTLYRATPPVANNNIFAEVDLTQCTLTVSCMGVEAYGAATPWSGFGTIVDAGCTATLTAVANHADRGTVSGGGIYDVGTAVVLNATPAEGFFLACWSDGDTLNPRVVTLTADRQLTACFFAFRHDTIVDSQTQTQHDTITVVLHHYDTVYVHDTVGGTTPTFFHLRVESGDAWRGLAVGSCIVPAGTEIEICGLPLEGYRFSGWLDGSVENPRRVLVTAEQTYTALFATAAGLDAPEAAGWTASVDGRMLTVDCGVGERLRLYDLQGRCLLSTTATAGHTTVVLPTAGAYLVQVADGAARRIVATTDH